MGRPGRCGDRAAGSPDTIALPGSAPRTRRIRRSSPPAGFGSEAAAAGQDGVGATPLGDTYPSSSGVDLIVGTACRRWGSLSLGLRYATSGHASVPPAALRATARKVPALGGA